MTFNRQTPEHIQRSIARQLKGVKQNSAGPLAVPDATTIAQALRQILGPGGADGLAKFLNMDNAPVDVVDRTAVLNANSQIIAQGRRNRRYLLLLNIGAAAALISFGKPASAFSMPLPVNGFFEPNKPFSSSINGLSAVGTTVLLIEG